MRKQLSNLFTGFYAHVHVNIESYLILVYSDTEPLLFLQWESTLMGPIIPAKHLRWVFEKMIQPSLDLIVTEGEVSVNIMFTIEIAKLNLLILCIDHKYCVSVINHDALPFHTNLPNELNKR